VIRRLWRMGFRRGVLGGSRAWTAVAVVAGALHLFSRVRRNEPVVVYSEKLEPGETLVLHHERKPGQGRVALVGAPVQPS